MLRDNLKAALGAEQAELVLKNASVINVFTETVEIADVAVHNGYIAGVGQYEGRVNIDCTGKFVAPGFLDGHIHLESSMLRPAEFTKAVLPHGTSAVITDPHEIANVCGIDGIRYMMESSKNLPMDVYFVMPSCVPATSFDENGYSLRTEDLEPFYENDRVLGLAEVMDYYGTIHGNSELLAKIEQARLKHKIVDGHAPGLYGKEACAYIATGVGSDHECTSFEEAKEKLSLGQWIMIREGTAAKNLDALMGLFTPPYHQRAILVTDDKHPSDLLKAGHMDDIIRMAVEKGADPCIAVKMATLNTALYFKLANIGAVAPGYQADLVILSDLKSFHVEKLIKQGEIVYQEDREVKVTEPAVTSELLKNVHNCVSLREVKPEDFGLPVSKNAAGGDEYRVIQFIKGEIVTKEIRLPLIGERPEVSVTKDILKLVCVERHHDTGHIGIGFANGYGLKKGAVASSVSHDSHNIIAIGTNDADIAEAVNGIRMMQGGFSVALEGKLIASLALPIAGLMSELDAESLAGKIREIKQIVRELGVPEGIDPFMTLAFVSLPVIPEIRLLPSGLFDVSRQERVPVIVS